MLEKFSKKRFTETKRYLNNPHRGCCTFQKFNGDPLFPGQSWSEQGPLEFPETVDKNWEVTDGYLPCSVSYCRWFWDVLEPEEGKYDFSFIEKSLEICAAKGQTMTIRLMPYGSGKQSQIPNWYKKKYPTTINSHKGFNLTVPDPESKEYQLKWGQLLKAFATKFDNNPLLEAIDIAFIGPWGEGAGNSSDETTKCFVDLYRQAFNKTIVISQLSPKTFKYAKEINAGWRVDCFGDLKSGGSNTYSREMTTNHMFDSYPKNLIKCEAQDVWQTAPVFMETCSVPMTWFYGGKTKFIDKSYDIDFIIEQGFKYHMTYFMPKSTKLPAEWMEKLYDFCEKIGYRFMLRQAICQRQVNLNADLSLNFWIENIGVAPIYYHYDLSIRLRQDHHEEILKLEHVDIKKWLPGSIWLEENIKLNNNFKPGLLEVDLGITNQMNQVAVKFVIEESFADGWVRVGDVVIT